MLRWAAQAQWPACTLACGVLTSVPAAAPLAIRHQMPLCRASQAEQVSLARRRLAVTAPLTLLPGAWRSSSVRRIGSHVNVAGATQKVSSATASVAAIAPSWKPAGSSLTLNGASGQISFVTALRSGGVSRAGYIGSLSMTLLVAAPASGRRLSAACTTVSVQVRCRAGAITSPP